MKYKLFLIILLGFILRIYQLGDNPPSLYWDEASLGYNAFTIATSGRDEHGERLPIARFIAFGDYKPPGYIYATVPSIFIFGLNEFSVRLPSMLAGFFMVIMTYYIILELFKNEKLALLSSFIMAISPWAIQFSRAAFESNLAAFFNLSGIYLFILSRRKRWVIVLSYIMFVLSFYTFNANRIIAPLILLFLFFLYFKDFKNNFTLLILSSVISVILILPSTTYLTSRESRLRFQEVSIFNNLEPIKISNSRIETDNNLWYAKIFHNRRLLFFSDFLKHYFDNFSGRFLFTHGDVNPRLSIQEMGQLYIWDLIFLLLGIFATLISKDKRWLIIYFWMLIVPIPAATAKETPHALRILSILPTYQIFIAYGVYRLFIWSKRVVGKKTNYLFLIIICIILSGNIYYYLHNYYKHYPISWSGEWQYGYKQMINYISEIENNYDRVLITNSLGRPYIYYLFNNKYGLNDFMSKKVTTRDWFGFWDVQSIGNIKFNLNDLDNVWGRTLIVTTPNRVSGNYILLKKISNLEGKEVFWIVEKT